MKTSSWIPFSSIKEPAMQRIGHTARIKSSKASNSFSLRRQGSNFSSSSSGSRPGSAGRQYNTATDGGTSSSMRVDSSEPPDEVNPAVSEALNKVAEALAVAEETAQKVDTLPSARLPTIVRYLVNFLFIPFSSPLLSAYIFLNLFLPWKETNFFIVFSPFLSLSSNTVDCHF